MCMRCFKNSRHDINSKNYYYYWNKPLKGIFYLGRKTWKSDNMESFQSFSYLSCDIQLHNCSGRLVFIKENDCACCHYSDPLFEHCLYLIMLSEEMSSSRGLLRLPGLHPQGSLLMEGHTHRWANWHNLSSFVKAWLVLIKACHCWRK